MNNLRHKKKVKTLYRALRRLSHSKDCMKSVYNALKEYVDNGEYSIHQINQRDVLHGLQLFQICETCKITYYTRNIKKMYLKCPFCKHFLDISTRYSRGREHMYKKIYYDWELKFSKTVKTVQERIREDKGKNKWTTKRNDWNEERLLTKKNHAEKKRNRKINKQEYD